MEELSLKPALIVDTLAEEIIRGQVAPGARLGQDQLAERFGCSHVTVREALQRLVQMELATSQPRRGVRAFKLAEDDHAEILEMRMALEPLALRRSVMFATGKNLEEIEIFRRNCDQANDPITWEKSNRMFHLSILQACDRPRLLNHVEQLQRLSAVRFHSRWRDSWSHVSDKDHGAILEAMKKKDEDTACAILVRHLSRG